MAVVGFASPASAGNGTNNFYLTGTCGMNWAIGWAAVDFTNYDNGANQVYHTNFRRSGVAYQLNGVYIDGVYKGKSHEMFINVSGHGAHTVKAVGQLIGGPTRTCSVVK